MHQNKYMHLIICFFICLGLIQPQAYKISGVILDAKTEKELNDVNIYIQDTSFGTITDNRGIFQLFLEDYKDNHADINIKIIGYKEEIIHVDFSNNNVDLGRIFLKTQLLEMDVIHIHSHRHSSNQISDILLSGQKLNDNLAGNIAKTLSNQPNIGVSSFGTVTSKPVLRGYSGDRFLLTKDGNKTGDLSTTSTDHAIALDMTEVNEIEIVRGPKALVYGSNAIGGVINTGIVGNPKTRVDKLFKKILMGGESFNKGVYGNLILYIPIKSNQINILLSNKEADNQSTPIGTLDNTYSKQSNYKVGFTRYYPHSYLNLIIENFNLDYGIPPSLEGHINGVDIELIKNTIQLNYHYDLSFFKFNQLEMNYNFIDYIHKEFENNLDYSQVELGKNTHNLKIELESYNLIIGSELNYKQFLPGGLYFTPRTDEWDLSLYGFNEIEFDQFDLLGSFRLGSLSIKLKEKNLQFLNLENESVKDRDFNYISISMGLRKVFNKFEINSWFMNTMKAPQIEELYSDGPHLGSYSYEIGEPNLSLEKIYGFESSILYTSSPITMGLTTFYNYSPYYYQMTKVGECPELNLQECLENGFIQAGVGSSGWLYRYQTRGVESLIRGLEYNLTYDYRRFRVRYDFSLVRADNLTSGFPLPYINPDKQILNIDYKKNIIKYNIRFSKIHSQNRLGEFESYTPSTLLIDLNLSAQFSNNNITFQINNILDKTYFNHLSKIKSISPEPGRSVAISYKVLL